MLNISGFLSNLVPYCLEVQGPNVKARNGQKVINATNLEETSLSWMKHLQ